MSNQTGISTVGVMPTSHASSMDDHLDDPSDFGPSLLARVRSVLDGASLSRGGYAAQALSDLAHADIRMSCNRDAAERWVSLSDAQIISIAADLDKLIAFDSKLRLLLPGGSEAVSEYPPGMIRVGPESMGIDVDKPGLHGVEDLVEFGGGNLEFLIGEIERLSRNRPFATVGPAEAIQVEDRDMEHYLQWAQCDNAAGVRPIFAPAGSCSLPLCVHSREEVAGIAERVVEHLAYFWNNTYAIGRDALLAREAGRRIAAENEGVTLHDIAFEIGVDEIHLRFMAWQSTCRRGLVVSKINPGASTDAIRNHFGPASFPVSAAAISDLHSAGADGRIEELAAAVIRAAPDGGIAALRRLGESHETYMTLESDQGPLRYHLSWRRGSIQAMSVWPAPFTIVNSTLAFRQTIPVSAAVAARGEPLGRFFSLPFPCDAWIETVTIDELGTTVDVKNEGFLVNCSEGRIWR